MNENKDMINSEDMSDIDKPKDSEPVKNLLEFEDIPYDNKERESMEDEHYARDDSHYRTFKSARDLIEEKDARAKSIFDFTEMLIYAFAAILLIFTFVARVTVVEGDSMLRTLHDGDRLLISDLGYSPKAGDIVVFQTIGDESGEPLIKRVIATEGQAVDIDFSTWTLTVDGVVVDEEAYRYFAPGYPTIESDYEFPITVEEGHVFVLGDNRNNSRDSRDSTVGQVDERSILGRVLFRLSLSNFGPVK